MTICEVIHSKMTDTTNYDIIFILYIYKFLYMWRKGPKKTKLLLWINNVNSHKIYLNVYIHESSIISNSFSLKKKESIISNSLVWPSSLLANVLCLHLHFHLLVHFMCIMYMSIYLSQWFNLSFPSFTCVTSK